MARMEKLSATDRWHRVCFAPKVHRDRGSCANCRGDWLVEAENRGGLPGTRRAFIPGSSADFLEFCDETYLKTNGQPSRRHEQVKGDLGVVIGTVLQSIVGAWFRPESMVWTPGR